MLGSLRLLACGLVLRRLELRRDRLDRDTAQVRARCRLDLPADGNHYLPIPHPGPGVRALRVVDADLTIAAIVLAKEQLL
jgi:hypothetical protein